MVTRAEGRHFEDYTFSAADDRVKVPIRYVQENADDSCRAAHFYAVVADETLVNTDLGKLHEIIRKAHEANADHEWAHYIEVRLPSSHHHQDPFVSLEFQHLLLSDVIEKPGMHPFRLKAPCWMDEGCVAWYGYEPGTMFAEEQGTNDHNVFLPPKGLPPHAERYWTRDEDTVLIPHTPGRWQVLSEIKAQIMALRDRLRATLTDAQASDLLDKLATAGPALLLAAPAARKGKRRG